MHDSLDERSACDHFLGKSLEEAEILFRENASHYQDDLIWMGPVAFRYYVPAFVAYLKSEHSVRDSDAASSFAGLLEYWVDSAPSELGPISDTLLRAAGYVIEHWKKFEIDDDTYAGLRARYEGLLSHLRDLQAG